MRITELHPELRGGPPHWGTAESFAEATSIEFDCPGCVGTPRAHRIWCPFLGKYDTKGPAWTQTGQSLETLTFIDTPGHTRSVRVTSGCLSHFNVTAGAIEFYGDSGHNNPRNPPMAESETKTTDPTVTEAPATEVVKSGDHEFTVGDAAPPGYFKTHFLQWLGGVLHQRHDAPHAGQQPAAVWVAVPGEAIPEKLDGEAHPVETAPSAAVTDGQPKPPAA